MRNTKFLDNPQPEDKFIGEIQEDENGKFRITNGTKHYIIDGETQREKDLDLVISRWRASVMDSWDYLNMISKR